eukprot:TRINITY_DN9112_c0_g1::TRINITY_DN9112_c0_g1_i1::g.18218::m.18218 TRINITY_DN9112_c0_g1::TRINITY_DN9112_c0_g1_i1::g.18218  ORF type:complete len:180 (+),score=11.67,sp/Q9ST43/PH1_ARATH/41.23/3e-26,PH/PF00169.24/4.8e-23,PH_11/PF15413.1/5.1e-08,PH_3/PF14593.1/1.3e-08,PH_9/PF15410.1/0.00014,PH_8/PF15409.1/0.0023,PH_6/PF15406.1/0.015,PH_6/PF15406.1/1.9e+03 TRINITY_DN9112_c0_g1_i1:30-542(+)
MAPALTGKKLKEGWLTKQGGIIRNWKERWFILTDSQLVYFKDKDAIQPQALINLKQCTSIKGAEELLQKDYSFQLQTPDRTYFFLASSEQDKTEWINAIGRAIIGLSSVMVDDYDPNNPQSIENDAPKSTAAADKKASPATTASADRRSSTRYGKATGGNKQVYLGDDEL